MILRFYENLLLKIREHQVILATRITSGGCKDYPEYKHVVGQVEGLKLAEKLSQDVYDAIFQSKKLFEDDECID